MIEREEREKKILEILRDSETLVSGTYLAELFDVSRQVIVQDIAILKAKNIDIISTNRGYRLLSKGIKKGSTKKHHTRGGVPLLEISSICSQLYHEW